MNDPITMRKTSDTSAEIMVYGDIGSMFDDGLTAKMFADQLKQLGKLSEINVRMNSVGGEVFEAMAIFNTLNRHPARKIVDVDGAALSAASLVAMAGDRIRMADNALMMVHNPWGRVGGTAAEMRARADQLDKLETAVRKVYADRTGIEDQTIDDLMAAETWMTASEAVEKGFADEVTAPMRVTAYVERERYRRIPSRLLKPKTTAIQAYKDRIAAQKA